MKRFVEKFYDKVFAPEPNKDVPYANKIFMFYFTLAISAVVIFLIVRDILKNLGKI